MINLRVRLLLVLSFLICSHAVLAQVRLSGEEAQKLILETAEPTYSPPEKILRMQGEVKVDVTVSGKGQVEKVRFVSGNSLLIGSANKTVRMYKFKPHMLDGKAASFIATIDLFFSFGATRKEVAYEMETARKYFAQFDTCRKLLREEKYPEAERSCRLAVSIAEKLPANRYMEKHSAYRQMAATLLWQQKAGDASSFLSKALAVGKPHVGDTNAETGEVYFLLGQANHMLGKTDAAREFYTKAENTYRAAFISMGDSDIREFYPRPIVNILEVHLLLLENAGLTEERAKVEKRLAQTRIEFAEFLKN